jgi:hypothetical protein
MIFVAHMAHAAAHHALAAAAPHAHPHAWPVLWLLNKSHFPYLANVSPTTPESPRDNKDSG